MYSYVGLGHSKASFNALTFSFSLSLDAILALRRTERCHISFVISHLKL